MWKLCVCSLGNTRTFCQHIPGSPQWIPTQEVHPRKIQLCGKYIYINFFTPTKLFVLLSDLWSICSLMTQEPNEDVVGSHWKACGTGIRKKKKKVKDTFLCSCPTNTARAPGRWPHLSTGLSKIYIGNNIICIIIFHWPKTFIYKTV